MVSRHIHKRRIHVFWYALSLCIMACTENSDTAENARAELGNYLFFDARLSYNRTKSCASCHDPAWAFSDGYRRSITATGDIVLHNSPSLINVASLRFFDWANPNITSLEKQHERPLLGEHPVELGVKGKETEILRRFKEDKIYTRLYRKTFPGESDPITLENSIRALAAFVRTLESYGSPYDRYVAGDTTALTASEKKGIELFFSERTKCAVCHPPPLFTLANQNHDLNSVYRNIGLYNPGNKGRYPSDDPGLSAHTLRKEDDGKFRIPSLRNVSLTAPYMHDGSVATLPEVLDLYQAGGRVITAGPMAGDGRLHPGKDPLITGFALDRDEKSALIDFLFTLTDTTLQTKYTNPFKIIVGN